jgi:formate hydrogenlyase subunit 3/multisubunit Na+/H+ antiporter MnhD subunit
MFSGIFISLVLLSFAIYIIPNRLKYGFTLALIMSVSVISSIWSIDALFISKVPSLIDVGLDYLNYDFILRIDELSAFFILTVNFTVITGFIYAYKYLEPYYRIKYPLSFSIHYFSYFWLYLSMITVVMLQNGITFIILWEIMAISSFMLVIFNAENRVIMKTGISYLIQMHVGMLFILTAFLIAEKETGIMGFNALTPYFSSNPNIFLFLLFFIGFGMKAGFIPLHTWLPLAHPSAPSHVSGVMSGVMIKMGIYGILRVISSLRSDLFTIGVIILSVSLLTGVLGIMSAITQRDIKKMLAYSTIENAGIIGIGMGLGVIGLSLNDQMLTLLGFSGALVHVFNHSLFKSLLFYAAGSVNHATHTKDMELLGGLIKKMPHTAFLFLIGSLAICGLPPFNGFISEYLIYSGMFSSLSGSGLYVSFIILSGIVGLALIGGLALFCFTRAFGITFLGQERSGRVHISEEVSRFMLAPGYIIAAVIMLIGLASSFLVIPAFETAAAAFTNLPADSSILNNTLNNLLQINIMSGLFIIIAAALFSFRRYIFGSKKVTSGPTWGCGYTAGTSRHQYTAASYSDNFIGLANPVLGSEKIAEKIAPSDIFPVTKKFHTESKDIFNDYIIRYPKEFLLSLLKKIAVMQTGQINHYILYTFVFIIGALVLTYFEII